MTGLAGLERALPGEAVLETVPANRWPWMGRAPEAVIRPGSAEEVQATVRWAAEAEVGVLPLGTGAHAWLAGPERPFVVLSTERLVGIEIYEPGDLTVTARAGTSLGEIAARLRAHGQWLPFDPPDVSSRTLGGLAAAGESGPAWTGYGDLRNHVLGATVVCGDGRVLRLGGRVVKNVAGFDLLKPVVGSRGRLAVVTSVCVRAFPTPASDRLLVLRADRLSDLIAAAGRVGTAPVLPVSSVLLGPAEAVGAAAALVVRLHGAARTVDADQRRLEEHVAASFERVQAAGVIHAALADHASDGAWVVAASVLPSRLGALLERTSDALRSSHTAIDAYAGTLRVASSEASAGPSPDEVVTSLRAAVEQLGGRATVLRAPVGVDRSALGSPLSTAEIELAAGVERVFDPKGVFWPARS